MKRTHERKKPFARIEKSPMHLNNKGILELLLLSKTHQLTCANRSTPVNAH